jgi:hypothetical protein
MSAEGAGAAIQDGSTHRCSEVILFPQQLPKISDHYFRFRLGSYLDEKMMLYGATGELHHALIRT